MSKSLDFFEVWILKEIKTFGFFLSILTHFQPLAVPYTLRLLYVLYEPFKAFLRLPVNVGKVCIQSAACEKIGVCNFAVLL